MKEAVEAIERRHAKPPIQLRMTRKLYSPEPGSATSSAPVGYRYTKGLVPVGSDSNRITLLAGYLLARRQKEPTPCATLK